MLSSVEKVLANRTTLIFLLGIFVASQTWILATLGGKTGPDLLQLQTVCLVHPTLSGTGASGRQILERWSPADVARFRRHYLLDLWIHPVIYALFFTSALFYTVATRPTKDPNSAIVHARMVALFIVLGAMCDIMENQRHSAIEFEPTLEAPDWLLWEACLLASTKWVIMNSVAGWLFWRIVVLAPSNHDIMVPGRKNEPPSPSFHFDADWIGPRPEDHRNTPVEAAGLLKVQGQPIPWTMSAPGAYSDGDRSYVVSPYAHYIGYAVDEIRVHFAEAPIRRFLALAVIRSVGYFFQILGFDDCVHFNNSLLSTNLWPNTIQWSQGQVEAINQELLSKTAAISSKERAIIWRSVDPLSQPNMTRVLANCCSCIMLPARIVNWSDYSADDFNKKELYQKNNFKKDIKLFQKRVGWDVVNQKNVKGAESAKYEMATIPADELTPEQAARIIDLFDQLYLVKYSKRNPQLHVEGLLRMAKTGFLTVDVLRERLSENIVGFSTGSTKDGVRTPSFIGYDVANDPKKELYRLVMIMIHCNLMRDGVAKCHHSGGANEFKRHRGATSTVEYSAVFIDHLPLYRQLPWKLAKVIADKIITVKNAH